jgi:PhnB protein
MADEPKPAPIEVYLTVKGADAASKFYQKAFGAVEIQRQAAEDGKRLIHCSMAVFGASLMFSDEFPEMGMNDTASPLTRGGASVTVHVNLGSSEEVDAVMAKAKAEGSKITFAAERTFWGAYFGKLIDPFGHSWSFAAPAPTPTA